MKIFRSNISPSEILPESMTFLREDMLFFDIETTGLSSSNTRIYCIGTGFFNDGQIRIEIRIIDGDDEEAALLAHFAALCQDFQTIVTFNGNRFDLPFTRTRATLYGIDDPFTHMTPLDLYEKSESFRKLLPLDHYRQKSFEAFLGIGRDDLYNGGELIAVYHRYKRTHREEDLHNLYIHNYEDVRGMFSLLSLLSYDAFVQGGYTITAHYRQDMRYIVRASLDKAVPRTVRVLRSEGNLVLRGQEAFFELPVLKKRLRHYFPDYKNYYYLPEEGIVVHKSVGSFVPADRREKAKKANCYAEKDCLCLHAAAKSALCYLQENAKDTTTWLELPEKAAAFENEDFKNFLQAFIRSAASQKQGPPHE